MNEAKIFRTKILKIASMKQKNLAFASINVPMQQKTVQRKKDCSDMDLTGDLAGVIGAIFLYY
jgi:hypothetical protein